MTKSHATVQEVWDGINELRKAQDRLIKSQAETNRQITKFTNSLDEAHGNFNNKWGQFLENLVNGGLIKLLSERNIEVIRVQSRTIFYKSKGQAAGDFDLIAINGEEIVVVEVKTTLKIDDVDLFVTNLKNFKKHFPEHSDKKIYGAVAYLTTESEALDLSKVNRLFIIEAVGGKADVSVITNSEDFRPKEF